MFRKLASMMQHPAAKTMIATMIVGVGMKMLGEVRDGFHEEITGARATLVNLYQAQQGVFHAQFQAAPHAWPSGERVEFDEN